MADGSNHPLVDTAMRFVDLLRARGVDFESAWLFGSAATGRATEDSDIDIGIVMHGVTDRFFKELDLMKYRREVDLRIDPHILSHDEVDSPFFMEVAKGIRLA